MITRHSVPHIVYVFYSLFFLYFFNQHEFLATEQLLGGNNDVIICIFQVERLRS